ncbi:MAG: hypothetical protein AB1758_09125 [Candidatus Eremiobacterota bacterium]
MKKWLLLAAAAVTLAGATASPSQADSGNMIMRDPVTIKVEGVTYEGVWAMIGERPYVGVESFGKALGYPRHHNAKGWCLNPPDGKHRDPTNPFVLAVEAAGKRVPTARFAGATMVDLRSACEALDIPFHYDFHCRIFEVGSPYEGEIMKGALYRWHANHYDWHAMGARPWLHWESSGGWGWNEYICP